VIVTDIFDAKMDQFSVQQSSKHMQDMQAEERFVYSPTIIKSSGLELVVV